MKRLLLLMALCSASFSQVIAACATGFNEVIIRIVPDGYPNEISWQLTDSSGVIITSGTTSGDTLCLAENSCAEFIIHDSFGDGILTPGGYWIYIDGIQVASGNAFGSFAQYQINCDPGAFCTEPLPLDTGTYTGTFDNSWFIYTAPQNGTYNLTTCGMNTCNTQIWVYQACPMTPYSEVAEAAYAYNDDNNCGTQANLNVTMLAGQTYFIRIGDYQDDCTGSIDFTFSFVGPIQGCMDPTACNFNPMAVIPDSTCIYYPDPSCAGPDLQFDSASFISSLSLTTHMASNCDVAEGCVTGYGLRYVIRFTSKIDNVGTLDYYIGSPSSQPGMFNLNNCHGHAHYEGYGDYRVFDSLNNVMPVGHKNGYCVIDLCGFGQYTCSNMGISAGCYDAYGAGTQCQWIDITDLPEGEYRVAIIINSQHLPDAFGRHETNYLNNALQVCINITRDSMNVPSYTLLPNCTPFVDCMGVPGGASVSDCNNVCNGSAVFGDTYSDGVLDSADVETYMDLVKAQVPSTSCYDLNGDSEITVYDATLVNWCLFGNSSVPGGSPHTHCRFPRNITHLSDSAGFAITNINFTGKYIDVELLNPTANLKAFQFALSGVNISSVVSLVDPVEYPADVRFNASNEVFGISHIDSTIARSTTPQQLVRIYFSTVTDTVICITNIREAINQNAERTTGYVYGDCVQSQTVGLAELTSQAELIVIPNPATDKARIHFSGKTAAPGDIRLYDLAGNLVETELTPLHNDWYEIDLSSLPMGVYMISVSNESVYGRTKLIKVSGR